MHTLYRISISCEILQDPLRFRAVFLVAFYFFLRMSNVTPHRTKLFSKDRHFLRQDFIFAHPGLHRFIKWTKTLQDHNSHYVTQLSKIKNLYLCPIGVVRSLLRSRPLPPEAPLFANNFPPSIKSLIFILEMHLGKQKLNELKAWLDLMTLNPSESTQLWAV